MLLLDFPRWISREKFQSDQLIEIELLALKYQQTLTFACTLENLLNQKKSDSDLAVTAAEHRSQVIFQCPQRQTSLWAVSTLEATCNRVMYTLFTWFVDLPYCSMTSEVRQTCLLHQLQRDFTNDFQCVHHNFPRVTRSSVLFIIANHQICSF